MTGYTKLFHSILASTVWREPNEVRLVWITMLAMADRYGLVEGSVPGLADFARVSVEDCRSALERLASPDPDSRSKEDDGRRIRPVDGGWQLVNHAKYRAKMSADDRREYLRRKQQQYRAKQRSGPMSTICQQPSTNVSAGRHIAEADTDPKADPKAEAEAAALTRRPPRPTTRGRLTLHPWQIDELIKALGPHADAFDVDAWIWGLSAKADAEGLVVDRKALWPWVQSELVAECRRRGLPVATDAPAPTLSKRTAGLMAVIANVSKLDKTGG